MFYSTTWTILSHQSTRYWSPDHLLLEIAWLPFLVVYIPFDHLRRIISGQRYVEEEELEKEELEKEKLEEEGPELEEFEVADFIPMDPDLEWWHRIIGHASKNSEYEILDTLIEPESIVEAAAAA